ncbi:MAG: type II toxin-antitoxin system prevent-host-death family antitoxin [Verrucomicrobia bacterium]|nr:type II toxin-antitoxin system prevent-host-death family antitoxin [Verrucomicrobiota bacterium]
MKTKTIKYPHSKAAEPAVLREVTSAPGIGSIISVRSAKAHLSALLELVAGGREITITSDGEPKAVLSPVAGRKARKVFTGTWEHLKKMPVQSEGPFAEEIIRADRDGRGW